MNILQTGLFVDQTGDMLNTASMSRTMDGGLHDTPDVVTQNLGVTLRAALSKTLSQGQRS